MVRVLLQGVSIIIIFFATWFTLNGIDWMTLFRVEKVTQTTEEKLGELLWELIKETEKEIDDVKVPLDSLLSKLCLSNGIDQSKIKFHIIESSDVNAFALPNNHLIINSGLVLATENEIELSGVISHELAHIELNHVMKKLVKEVGLSVIISITTGKMGSETVQQVMKLLSSSAFDRSLEKEADLKAADYMISAELNPEEFANFLYRMGEGQEAFAKYTSWISTHPNSKERAEIIIDYSTGYQNESIKVIHPSTWNKVKESLQRN